MASQSSSDPPEGPPLTQEHSVTETRAPSFSTLPPELRLMVWEQALPGTRIIGILSSNRIGQIKCTTLDHDSPTLNSLRLATATSQFIVLANYPICFDTNLARPIHFCYERDILHFYDLEALDKFFTAGNGRNVEEIRKVRIIAVNVEPSRNPLDVSLAPWLMPGGAIARAWMRFGSLTEVILLQPVVIRSPDPQNGGRETTLRIRMDKADLSTDIYVEERQRNANSPADQNPDAIVTTEAFHIFQERAGTLTTQ